MCLSDSLEWYSGEKWEIINSNSQGCLEEGTLQLFAFLFHAYELCICANAILSHMGGV